MEVNLQNLKLETGHLRNRIEIEMALANKNWKISTKYGASLKIYSMKTNQRKNKIDVQGKKLLLQNHIILR